MNTHLHYSPRNSARGLTLVELLVAMVASLFLMGGVIQIFVSNKAAYRSMEGLSRAQENGRVAIELISRDARMASFWGCANNVSKVSNRLDSTKTGYVDFLAGDGLAGTNGATLLDNDSVTFRGAFGEGYQVQSMSGNDPVICGNSAGDIAQGDFVLVGDCGSADIFQVTNSPSASVCGADTATINHDAGTCGTICPGNAVDTADTYDSFAYLYPARQVQYSIQTGTGGEPALFRTENEDGSPNAQEMVDGVENLQVRYGLDTDSDGSANAYVDASSLTTAQWADVVSIRVAVVTRSYSDNVTSQSQSYSIFGVVQNPTDRRSRQVYTATLTLRNRTQ